MTYPAPPPGPNDPPTAVSPIGNAPSVPPGAGGTPKAPRGWLWAALVFFVLGCAGCGVTVFGGFRSLAVITDIVAEMDQPSAFGAEVEFVAESERALVLLTDSAVCSGADSEGNPVSFSPVVEDQTIDANETSYRYFLVFDTVPGSLYTLTCGALDSSNIYAVISDPGIDEIGAGFVMLAAGAGSFILFMLVALICLIVGLVRRSNWKKRNQTWPGGPPAGQDPYGQDPYGQNPYGQNPYGQNPYGQNPYGQNPYGQNPYAQPPYQGPDPGGPGDSR